MIYQPAAITLSPICIETLFLLQLFVRIAAIKEHVKLDKSY